MNVTVPVGVPLNMAIVAVKVTEPLKLDGLTLEISVTPEVAVLTVCVIAAEVLPVLLVSPP